MSILTTNYTDYTFPVADTQSKEEGKDQESIQSSTTPDPGYQWVTSQLDITNESQEVSTFPAGDHKASINRAHESITKTRQK